MLKLNDLNMKRKLVIPITFIVYLIAMIVMFFGVQEYIKNKDNRLRVEIHDKIDDIFAHQEQFVDIAYSGYNVGYEKIGIPRKPQQVGRQDEKTKGLLGDLYKQRQNDWKENYGDLYKMYRVFYKRSDWAGPFDYEDGWNLVIIKHDYEGVYVNWFFPYAVGYKKQDYQWEYSYLPSVESAVNETFEFFTSNPKSQFYKDFEKGSFARVWAQINDAENEYYYMAKDENRRFWHSGVNGLFESHINLDDNSSPFQYGYMHNGYYRVFTALTQPQTYTIKKYAWNPDEQDKKNLWKYWSIGLTLLLLLIIIPSGIINRKHNKEKEESLYDKLKRLCNPVNFISGDNYDKDKVDKANAIFKRLTEITPEDKDALDEIRHLAVLELGINLINNDVVEELKRKVNPKNFISPYNAEKLALANELYAIITKKELTYSELEYVREKSKIL